MKNTMKKNYYPITFKKILIQNKMEESYLKKKKEKKDSKLVFMVITLPFTLP